MSNKTLILDQQQITLKLKRMAFQIWERNTEEKELVIIGVEQSGSILAAALAKILQDVSPLKITLHHIVVSKKDPLNTPAQFTEDIAGKSVILIDDVANSGRTLLYAMKPLLEYSLKKILIGVLVDRKHKSFPVTPDIVGYSMATTLQDHIEVECKGNKIVGAYLC